MTRRANIAREHEVLRGSHARSDIGRVRRFSAHSITCALNYLRISVYAYMCVCVSKGWKGTGEGGKKGRELKLARWIGFASRDF